MFSFLNNNKRVLGLDITEEYIRYVEILKTGNSKKIISYGEEKIPQKEQKNGLLIALSNIKRKTKTTSAVVSLPKNSSRFEFVLIPSVKEKDVLSKLEFRLTEEKLFSYGEVIMFYEKVESINKEDYYKVLISTKENIAFFRSVFLNSGLIPTKFLSHKDALINSCIKNGALSSALICNMEENHTDFILYYPFENLEEMSFPVSGQNVGHLLKEVYVDFYKENQEKIGRVLASGSLANNKNLLNFLSKETRLDIEEVNVLSNVTIERNSVPMIPKNESFKYALAIGLGISE